MADVRLNLIYNDNGAERAINSIVNQLRQVEVKSWRINFDYAPIQSMGRELQKQIDSINKLKKDLTTINSPYSGQFLSTSFSSMETVVDKFQQRLNSTRESLVQFHIELSARQNLGLLDDTDYSEKLGKLRSNVDVAKESLRIAKEQLASLGERFDISGAENSIVAIKDRIIELSNATRRTFSFDTSPSQTGWGMDYISPRVEKLGKALSAISWGGLTPKVSESAKQALLGGWSEMEYDPFEKPTNDLNDFEERVKKSNAGIALGYHQTWRGIQQIVTGVINSLQSIYDTWKSRVEAPLNLTGVSSLVSMLESMEGSLLLNQITSNISSGFSQGVERYDILQSFPAVMERIGYSADDASSAMDRLYQSVLGLPTSFGDIVQNTQFFTLVLDDLEKATDLAIAANNAFVASGANSQQISSGMRQLQYILEGTKLRSTQWYSLIRSMPLALREVGDALGYPDFSSFTEDLMGGKIASEELIDTLIDVGLNSEKLGGIIDVMKSRIQAALENVTNAGRRMGESIIESLDSVLQREGGKGLTENIKGVSSIIDHITETATDWIDKNGDKIQALVDKFFAIDWGSIVPSFLEGLVNIADRALDNIDKWIDDIGSILETVKTTFNSLDNARWVKLLSGGLSLLPSIAQIFSGASNIRLGSALVSAGIASGGSGFGTSLVGGGASLAGGFLPALGMGIGAGGILASIVDLVYQLINNDLSTGFKKWANNWGAFGNVFQSATSSGQNAFSNAVEFITESFEKIKDSGLLNEYRRRDIYSSRIGGILERYSQYDFADSNRISFLRKLSEYIEDFGIKDGIKLEEDLSRLIADINLVDAIGKPYDEAIDALEQRKVELLEELKSINEEIAKEFAGVEVNSFKFYEAIYGANKKFFSEQFEEASGWSYSNTTRDRAEFLEKNLPKVNEVLDDITNYALENYSDDEGVLAVVAKFMADFDWNDPDQLAVLIKNYGGKSMQEVFEQYFEQQAKNLNIDEAIRTALLEHQKELTEGRLEGINIEQEQLEEESQSLLAPYVEQLDDDFEFLKEDYGEAIDYVEKSGSKLVDIINNIFNRLSPEKPKNNLDSFFGSIYNTIRSWVNLINSISSRTITPRFSGSYGSEGVYSANGGFILPPKGTDTIPAMLTPGEYVQRRAAVQYFGKSFMDRINALDLRGALRSVYTSFATPYATGGFVRSDNRSYRDNHATVNQVFNSSNASTGLRRVSRFVRALN